MRYLTRRIRGIRNVETDDSPGVLEPYRRNHHVRPVEEVGNRGYCTFAVHGVKKMLENNGIAIEVTDKAVQWLADAGMIRSLALVP